MSCHFGHLRLGFLSILPLLKLPVGIFRFYFCISSYFGRIGQFPSSNDPWPKPIFLLARLVASTQLHPQKNLGRNRFFARPPCSINSGSSSKDPWPKPFFCWLVLWHQPSSILKGPLAETDFLLARRVASTQVHPQRTLGRNRFFAGLFCGINPAPSSKDPWPKPIFCWPALWHQPRSILKGPLAETDFLLARIGPRQG